MKAMWHGVVVAQSDATVVVEGNHYFPPDSVAREYLVASEMTSVCGWKGTANYYSLVVANDTNESAAWYYSQPKPAAAEIKDHVAFWRGVEIVD